MMKRDTSPSFPRTVLLLAALALAGCGPRVAHEGQAGSAGEDVAGEGTAGGDSESPSASASRSSRPIAPVPADVAPELGSENPTVTIEVYADFECPFCARSRETTDRVREEHDGVVVVYRFLPLSMHRNARPAANAALEVFRQAGDDAFWAYATAVYAHQDNLTRRVLVRLAREAGHDADEVDRAVRTGRHDARIDVDRDRARDAGVNGTPTYVVNGELVESPTYDELSIVVADHLDAL